MSKSKTGLDRSGAQRLRQAKKYPHKCPRCGRLYVVRDLIYVYDSQGEITVIGCGPCMRKFFEEEHQKYEEGQEARRRP